MSARLHGSVRTALLARRRGLLSQLFALIGLQRSRARLAHLDAHLLRDIGLTREQAEAEARRPPWDAPEHWRG